MAGEPASPSNCTVANITANTLEVSCLEGYDGGLPQIFVLQVLAVKSEKLVANLTSSTGPHFTVHALEAATPYEMNIWAQNAKGNSPSVVLMAETYVSAIQIDEYFKYLFLPKNENEEKPFRCLLCLQLIFLIGSGYFVLILFLQSVNMFHGDLYGNSHEASIVPDSQMKAITARLLPDQII